LLGGEGYDEPRILLYHFSLSFNIPPFLFILFYLFFFK